MSGATTFAGRSARQQHHAPHPTRPPRPLPPTPYLRACWVRWAAGLVGGGWAVRGLSVGTPWWDGSTWDPCGPTDFRVIC